MEATSIEQLPEHRRIIEAPDSPMTLWIELSAALKEAYTSQDEGLLRRFYELARWCWKSESDDLRTAVASAFYEHLPLREVTRRDMPRRFGRAAFMELRETFCYHLSPDDTAAFEREFLEAEGSSSETFCDTEPDCAT